MKAAKSNNKLLDKPALCILKSNEGDKVGATPWKTKQSKRLSSPGHSPTSKEPKISNDTNSAFTTPNRFEPLNETEIDDNTEMIHEPTNDIPPPPPPIFISSPLEFNEFAKSIALLVGENEFEFKSTTKHLKLTLTSISSYRQIIHLLNESKIEYFTYQAKEDKPYRVAIRNLHPTTDTNFIKDELSQFGFSVRNITNIKSKITKTALPIFFVDLNPDPSNVNIFNLSSLCYTKIKIEEPHSRRDLPQCHRCQAYGHTKTYCNREPRCVRCGACHLSDLCEKPKDTPATCALCGEAHPANYKGCTKHKLLQRSRNSKFNDLNQRKDHHHSRNPTQDRNSPDVTAHTSLDNVNQTPTSPTIRQFSYADSVKGNSKKKNHFSDHNPPPETSISKHLSSFINELQSLITPLLTLLTSLINKLITNNDTQY